MSFISFRRELLDRNLEKFNFLDGKNEAMILDIGGVKKRRGRFQIPSHLLPRWKTLNNNAATQPDILCELPAINSPDQNFEQILMTEVLEYVPEYKKLLEECHRILKKDGLLILSFPFLSPLHGDKESDALRITPTHFEKVVEGKFQVIERQAMGGPILVYFDLLKAEWITHGKHNVWQRLWWKKISLFNKLIIWSDAFFFKNPVSSTTGFWYVLKKT